MLGVVIGSGARRTRYIGVGRVVVQELQYSIGSWGPAWYSRCRANAATATERVRHVGKRTAAKSARDKS